MPERKINLEEIWKQKFPHGKLPVYAKEIAMEFARQLLELAAEKARTKVISEYEVIVNKQSILDTISQIE